MECRVFRTRFSIFLFDGAASDSFGAVQARTLGSNFIALYRLGVFPGAISCHPACSTATCPLSLREHTRPSSTLRWLDLLIRYRQLCRMPVGLRQAHLVFSFLLQQKLPIETQLQGRDFIFHYSTAYYITPVRLKQALQTLTGHANLKPILLVTYSAVLFVAVRMLAGMAAVPALIIFLVFSLVGGLDLAGMKAFGVKGDIVATLPGLGIGIPRNIEWWGVPGAPQSPTMHLYYSALVRRPNRHDPNHRLHAVIPTSGNRLGQCCGYDSGERVLECLCHHRARNARPDEDPHRPWRNIAMA